MKSLVKIFLITKDEYDIIEDFIVYYGSLFDYDNIVLIDNGSTHPHVLNIYEKYKDKINIIIDTRHFLLQGEILTFYMKIFRNTCEFMIPLDTDEFIYMRNEEKITKEKINNYLKSIPEDISIIIFKNVLCSIIDPEDFSYINHIYKYPIRFISKFYDQKWEKCFVRSKYFIETFKGNHYMEVTKLNILYDNELALLHYHETGMHRLYERSIKSVKAYEYVNINNNLEEQIIECKKNIPMLGGHHIRLYMIFLYKKYFIEKKCNGKLPGKKELLWIHNILENDIDNNFIKSVEEYSDNIDNSDFLNYDDCLLWYIDKKQEKIYIVNQVAMYLHDLYIYKYSTLKIITILNSDNDLDIFEKFIKYHGELIGYENIIVILTFDLKTLFKYDKIVYIIKDKYDSEIIAKYINIFKNHCTFLMPLFINEYLSFKDDKKITSEEIFDYLNKIQDDVSIIKYYNNENKYIIKSQTNNNIIKKSNLFTLDILKNDSM